MPLCSESAGWVNLNCYIDADIALEWLNDMKLHVAGTFNSLR